MNATICVDIHDALGRDIDALFEEVFIREQGVPEDEVFDEAHPRALFFLLSEGPTPVAAARLQGDGSIRRIGFVAVRKPYRAMGYGRLLMQAVLGEAAARGCREVTLNAQAHAQGFYERLGFAPCGKPIVYESGFVLIPMRLMLLPAGAPREP